MIQIANIRMRLAQLAFGLSLQRLALAENALDCARDACTALAAALPGNVAYPNTTPYIQANNFWSDRQAEVHPQCFVTPRSTEQVSSVIKILTSRNAPFTVKSGGHTAFAGGSNIADGVTVDLVYLNDITVSADRQTVSVGPGNRWINVSETLDPLKLAVVGGRVADVGVSGLILGGGISYFSGLKGWACDNVRNFEVVVSSGDIVNASPTIHPDLYWALRGGGGSNFGIVTRFDLASFDQGDLWTSSLIFPGALNSTLIPLFQNLTVNGLPSDPAAHTYFVLTYQPSLGGYIALTSFYHATIPSPPDSTPPVFAQFQSIPSPISNSTLVTNISTQSRIIDIPYGSRQTWWDTTVSATSATLLTDIVPLFEARNAALFAAAKGSNITPFLVFQPIPVNVLSAMQKNGGNALGLESSDGPLMIVQLTTTWEDARLDRLVEDSSRELIAKIESIAKKRKLDNGFVYMNYAGNTQQVQKRYGKDNNRRLKQIARKWDPQGKLAQLWRGYFKLDG
ncbi:FAD-binding PCMH-type domain-containing protein [Fusarium keratoplasticum]|uniref:FAD-binding PCMH-type domain-containing protein n=1 Tax=Fusarium keratoplasticum TaxID=1328300 RepID=A0ACC0RBH5_9HYPO|nr:FAD-binding PCMH-type domain-containing protein [Fusarium keratoplasticum]KAI8680499.1 FAD-binding PCMH-type domain-containing protein [Fusarium keratoplasticum]